MLETAVIFHASIECFLSGMSEGGMPQIMRQRYGFHQILIQCHAPRNRTTDLRNFDAVREAGTEQITFMIDEDLRLVFEAAERARMDDTVSVTLKLATPCRRGFSRTPT